MDVYPELTKKDGEMLNYMKEFYLAEKRIRELENQLKEMEEIK